MRHSHLLPSSMQISLVRHFELIRCPSELPCGLNRSADGLLLRVELMQLQVAVLLVASRTDSDLDVITGVANCHMWRQFIGQEHPSIHCVKSTGVFDEALVVAVVFGKEKTFFKCIAIDPLTMSPTHTPGLTRA